MVTESPFDTAMRFILLEEQGYVYHPKDPGGETKYGISKRAFPEENIRNLTPERARFLYEKFYWKECRCQDLPLGLALLVFDSAVNHGAEQASVWLQRAAGMVLAVDGKVGEKTLARVAQAPELELIERIGSERALFYSSLERRQGAGFIRGWLPRLVRAVIRATCYATRDEAWLGKSWQVT